MAARAVQSIDGVEVFTPGVKGQITIARPSTWSRWHEEEKAGWQARLADAAESLSHVHTAYTKLMFSRNHWRLAAVVGWCLVALLLVAGRGH